MNGSNDLSVLKASNVLNDLKGFKTSNVIDMNGLKASNVLNNVNDLNILEYSMFLIV